MKSISVFFILCIGVLCFTGFAQAQTCTGPAPCEPCFGPVCGTPTEPFGPAEMCLPDGCQPVVYSRVRSAIDPRAWFAVATSALPSTAASQAYPYPTIGVAGPCFEEDSWLCPNVYIQAYNVMLNSFALPANRAQRAVLR